MRLKDQIKSQSHPEIISGSSHYPFAKALAQQLDIPCYKAEVTNFPDGETKVVVNSIFSKQALVVQSLGKEPNQLLIETFLIVDALRRAGAKEVVLICPYLAYTRQNVVDKEGASLAARLFAKFLHEAGVDRLVTMDVHAEHIPSFYDFPALLVTAEQLFVKEIRKRKLDKQPLVVVGPDLGSGKLAASFAGAFGGRLALVQKKRLTATHVEVLSLVGEVKGMNVLLADDVCSTAGTLVSAAKVCREKGAKKIYACVTHGLFVEDAVQRIEKSEIDQLFVCDTISLSKDVLQSAKICVISTVPTFAAYIAQNVLTPCR